MKKQFLITKISKHLFYAMLAICAFCGGCKQEIKETKIPLFTITDETRYSGDWHIWYFNDTLRYAGNKDTLINHLFFELMKSDSIRMITEGMVQNMQGCNEKIDSTKIKNWNEYVKQYNNLRR